MATESQAYLLRIRSSAIGSQHLTVHYALEGESQDTDLLRNLLEKTVPGYSDFADKHPEVAIVFEETVKELAVHPEFGVVAGKKGRSLAKKAMKVFGKALPGVLIVDGIVTVLNIATGSYQRIQELDQRSAFGQNSVFDNRSDLDRFLDDNGFFSEPRDPYSAYKGIFSDGMDFSSFHDFDQGGSGETPWETNLRATKQRAQNLNNRVPSRGPRRHPEPKGRGPIDRHRPSGRGDGRMGRGTYGGKASARDPDRARMVRSTA